MKIDRPLLDAMEKRIGKQVTGWKPALVQDPIQKKIKSLLKTKGDEVSSSKKKTGTKARAGGNVINIMDALKKSLASEKRS